MSHDREAINTHLDSLGFQSHRAQHRGPLTHLFVRERGRDPPFRNANIQMTRLRNELRRLKVFPKEPGPKRRAGENLACTMRTVFRKPGESAQDLWRREEAGLHEHAAVRAASLRAPAPSLNCITNVFQVNPFVPRLYFSGYSEKMDAYVTVMEYAPGSPPTSRTGATGLAAVERALFTLWIRGVALPDLSREGVRVSADRAVIVDFTGARAPLKNMNAVRTSRNPLSHLLWDPPRWLHGLVRGAKGIDDARRAVWLWSAACARNGDL